MLSGQRSDLRFTFNAGPDAFEVVEFHLVEGLSETFHLEVELSSVNAAVDFGQVHGLVSSFQQGETGVLRTRYRAVVEPRLASLNLSSDCRFFQTLGAPDIAEVMLKNHALILDYELRVTNPHERREYCVQAGSGGLNKLVGNGAGIQLNVW